MAAFDLTVIGAGLEKIAELFDKLKGKAKDREIAAIMGQFQDAFFETKTKAFDLYTENTELKTRIAQMDTDHAKAVAQLKDSQSKEIAAINAQLLEYKTCLNEMIRNFTAKKKMPKPHTLNHAA